MSRITRFAFVLAIVALIAGLSACDEFISILSNGETPQMEGLRGEIPIGLVYPITGRLATFALPIQRGFELALEEINNSQLGDVRLKFIIEDDQGTDEGAVEAYKKLVYQDGVPIIFGPTTSDQAEAAFPIAEQNEVVAFSSSSNRAGLNAFDDFIFRAGLTTDVLLPDGVRENAGET